MFIGMMSFIFRYFLVTIMLFFTVQLSDLLAEKAHKPDQVVQEDMDEGRVKDADNVAVGRKKILDLVRQGVVIIKTKSHAGIDSWNQTDSWSGTGFIVDLKSGIIATNRHIVGEMAVCTYEIKFSDGTTVEGKLKYADPHYDFAFIQVDPKKFPEHSMELKFSKENIQINTEIYSMGNSAGDEFSTFKGTVFSVYEILGPFPEQSFRFSGLTVGGASGSPVFDMKGKVLGILYGGRFVSGAALPIRYVEKALNSLRKGKNPIRQDIGLVLNYSDFDQIEKVGDISPGAAKEYRDKFPHSQNKILRVDTRLVGSSAYKELKSGDIIWKINGQFVGPEVEKLTSAVDDAQGSIKLEVFRKGELVEKKLNVAVIDASKSTEMISFMGATWYGLTDKIRLSSAQTGGVFVASVNQASFLMDAIMSSSGYGQKLIRVTEINGHPINTLADLKEIIPNLLDKTACKIGYINYSGIRSFDDVVIHDREERSAVAKYQSKFDAPKHYLFNEKTQEWDITPIKK